MNPLPDREIEAVARAIFETWKRRRGSDGTWDELKALAKQKAPASSEMYALAVEEAQAAIRALDQEREKTNAGR